MATNLIVPLFSAAGAAGISIAASGVAMGQLWICAVGASIAGCALFTMLSFIVSNTERR